MTGRIVRVLAALIFGAAGGTVVMTGTAYAAACPSGTGVTVVVNSAVSCDANGGGPASSNFSGGGHSLQMYRGFVCSIDNYPDPAKACHSYAPANAYWGLFWANGKGGGWVYSSSGASSLNVPAGGWVAFKFQNSNSREAPTMRPYTPAPAPAPKPATKPKPKAKPSTTAPSKPNASASASAKAKAKATAKAKASASASASPGTSGDAAPSSDDLVNAANETDGSSSMVWVGAALAGLLVIGMAAALWRRRLAGRQP